MAITVVSGTPSGADSSLAPGEAERGHHKRPGGGQRSMLHTTPAPQQSMPARTGGSQGGQAILASSQHTSWHHQASEYQLCYVPFVLFESFDGQCSITIMINGNEEIRNVRVYCL